MSRFKSGRRIKFKEAIKTKKFWLNFFSVMLVMMAIGVLSVLFLKRQDQSMGLSVAAQGRLVGLRQDFRAHLKPHQALLGLSCCRQAFQAWLLASQVRLLAQRYLLMTVRVVLCVVLEAVDPWRLSFLACFFCVNYNRLCFYGISSSKKMKYQNRH